MEEIVAKLKSPEYLDRLCDDFHRLVSDDRKSSSSIKLLVQIFRNTEDPTWLKAVNPEALHSSVKVMCQNVKQASDADYQNYVASLLNIHRFTLKTAVRRNDIAHLDFVFRNPRLPMRRRHFKLYWIMLVDSVDSLVVCPDSEPTLSDLVVYVREFLTASRDVVYFCRNNLSWIVRKLFALFEACEDLDAALQTIFDSLFALCAAGEKDTSILAEGDHRDVFKNILVSLNIAAQIRTSSEKSVSSILKFSIKLFENSSERGLNYLNALSVVAPLFSLPPHKFPSDSHESVDKFRKAIRDVAINNDSTRMFFDFVLTLRKILSHKLSQWIKSSKETWKKHFSSNLRLSLLKLLKTVVENVNECNGQSVKCAKCAYENGAHDALQLASVGRSFIRNSAPEETDSDQLVATVAQIFNLQIDIVLKLRINDCPGWRYFWNNAEKNCHSDAILLHTLNANRQSLCLFSAYWSACIRMLSVDIAIVDHGNFSRALYNMAICHLDLSKYERALRNCYLSMAMNSLSKKNFNRDMTHGKFVIQIKAKMLDCKNSPGEYCKFDKETKLRKVHCECNRLIDSLQTSNVWTVCNESILADTSVTNVYSRLLADVDFGALLLLELEAYHSFWFSTVPVCGIIKSFQKLFNCTINGGVHNYCIIGLNQYKLLINYGKAITIINTQPAKLHNSDVMSFIRFAMKKYESYLDENFNNLKTNDKILINFLFGNVLKAYYEVKFYDKVNCDKFSPLALSATSDVTQNHHYSAHPDDVCDIAPTHLSLTLSTEQDILEPLFKAIQVWDELLRISDVELKASFELDQNKLYLEKSFETIESVARILSLRGLDAHSLKVADIACSLGKLTNNRIAVVRTAGFLIQSSSSQTPSVLKLIDESNIFVKELLVENESSSSQNVAHEYLLNLSIYYCNCDLREKGLLLLGYVQNKMLDYLTEADVNVKDSDDAKFVYAKLIDVQSLYISCNSTNNRSSLCYLSSVVNACVEYSELARSAGYSNWQASAVLDLWIESGLQAGKVALLLGLPRRARAILKSFLSTVQRLLLPRRTLQILLLLANIDLVAERFDDYKVKFDTIHYIMEERCETSLQNAKISCSNQEKSQRKTTFCDKHNGIGVESQFEMVLDVPNDDNKYNDDHLSGSPMFESSPFIMPSFIDHDKMCECCKCTSLTMFDLTLGMLHSKMNLYCKTGELKVAQSFVNGAFKVLQFLNSRLNYVFDNILRAFKNVSFDNIEQLHHFKMLTFTKCQFLTDVGFFLMKEDDCVKAEMLNVQAIDFLPPLTSNKFLLMQSVYEQKMSLMHSKLFCELHKTPEILDSFCSDFENKLLMTPQKSAMTTAFKTPTVKNMKPPSQIKRIRLPRGKTLFGGSENEVPEYNKPIIKLNLDIEHDDDKSPKKSYDNCKSLIDNEENLRVFTPAPKLSTRKKTLLLPSTDSTSKKKVITQSKINIPSSSLPSKSLKGLKRATSPENLVEIQPKSTAIKLVETKSSSASDKNVTKKYPTRKRLQ